MSETKEMPKWQYNLFRVPCDRELSGIVVASVDFPSIVPTLIERGYTLTGPAVWLGNAVHVNTKIREIIHRQAPQCPARQTDEVAQPEVVAAV